MSLYGSSVEYGLHCLLHLVNWSGEGLPSSRDLAEYQGVSPSFVAKLFTKLDKAGIVTSTEGADGGFQLAHPPGKISVLDVVDALEEDKPLFQCREIRANCILYGNKPPARATQGVCSIHAVMNEADRGMRAILDSHTLASLAGTAAKKIPAKFSQETKDWFDDRQSLRRSRGKQ